jgi:GGDEF domain-containing protein
MVPMSVLGLFSYEKASDELICSALIGPLGPIPCRLRTPLGQGLSGWVAATRQTILNSDPRLDFGSTSIETTRELLSAASVPLTLDDQLVGVLTLYSDEPNAFSEQHLKVLSLLAPRLAYAVSKAMSYDQEHAAQLWDRETGLPNSRYLREYIASPVGRSMGVSGSVLLIQIDSDSAAPGSSLLRVVANDVRSALRLGDLIFRLTQHEIVCILSGADAATANAITVRLTETLDRSTGDRPNSVVGLAIGCATPPMDGTGLDELVLAARQRLMHLKSELLAPETAL